MELHWLEAIVYGFVSGITEFLPISSHAHRAILRNLFGVESDIPLVRMFIHLGIICGLLTFLRNHLTLLRRHSMLKKIPPHRRKRYPDPRHISELALIKTASIPMVIGLLFYLQTVSMGDQLQLVAAFSVINGAVLVLPALFASANKNACGMSILDRLLIGLSSALSLLPGVSRVAAANSMALIRGADKQDAYRWSLLLSLPALLVMICWDVFLTATTGGTVTFLLVLSSLLCAVFAFLGTWISVSWMQSMVEKSSVSNFCYYSFGVALFAFILYLI